jgi:hypothetical protein
MENIDWDYLSMNVSPSSLVLLKKKTKRINWFNLSSNPSAIDILEKYTENINWYELS